MRTLVKVYCASSMLCLLQAVGLTADFAWIEGEKPTSHTVDITTGTYGKLLSGNVWLSLSAEADQMEKVIPADGVIFGYDFNSPSAGPYEVWNRVGFEGQRPPFDWRIDQGAWQTIKPDQHSDDLVELAFWVHVAWLKLGTADLNAGVKGGAKPWRGAGGAQGTRSRAA